MNVQAHLSGQISGQVQNQLQPQQNGNQQMQNLSAPTTGGAAAAGAHSVNVYNAEPELHRYRLFMQNKIFSIILQKQSQPVGDQQKQKFKEFAKRLEEGLFKAAQTKDDYLNMDTLESRLSSLLKRPPANSQNQRHPQLVNSSSSIGTMIRTPGMSNSRNSNMMTSSVDTMMISSSGCDSIAPIAANTGGLLPSSGMHNGCFGRPDGNLSNGYQQSPANFSISSGGNMSSMGVQRMESQMIPTPGFSNNNQSYMNVNSPKPLPQQFDQHQRQLMQGDGYGMSNADSLGSGNIYGAVTSVGSMMNAQSMSKTNSSLVNNQSNLHAPHQAGHIKLQSLDQFQQHPHQFQQQQLVQQQRLQKQQSQQDQHLLNNDAFGQSLLIPGYIEKVPSHIQDENAEKVTKLFQEMEFFKKEH